VDIWQFLLNFWWLLAVDRVLPHFQAAAVVLAACAIKQRVISLVHSQ
jgi:hypothetical protein